MVTNFSKVQNDMNNKKHQPRNNLGSPDPNQTDHLFLERALALAREHSTSGVNGPFGAVVVRDGQIIGEGWNRVIETADPTAHAEILAIRAACASERTHDLTGCTIYASCEPCPMCLAAIYWARIERVVFACDRADAARAGFDDSVIYEELGKPWEGRKIESRQMDRERGMMVLEAWIDNPARVQY